MNADIDGEGLYDRTGDSVLASVCAYNGADEAISEAEDDTEDWDETIDYRAGVEGSYADGANTDECEQTDNHGIVGVWWRGEEEGECCPVASEDT